MRTLLILLSIIIGVNLYAQPQPDPPVIESVTVQPNGDVKISWTPSPTAGITAYILYKYACSAVECNHKEFLTAIPANLTSIVDQVANANSYSESYKMAAYIGDETNLSEATNAHNTLFLDLAYYDSCSLSIDLNWTSYIGWDSGVKEYIIYKDSGSGPQAIASLLDTVYTDTDLTAFTDYTYYIEAHSNNGEISQSNLIKKNTAVPLSPNFNEFQLTDVVFDGQTVELEASVPYSSTMKQYELQFSNSADQGFQLVSSQAHTGDLNFYFTDDAHAADQPLFYRLNGVNICDESVVQSNVVQPIKLYIDRDLNDLNLQWNPSFYDDLNENYTVFYNIDDGGNQVLSTQSETGFEINIDNVGSGAGEKFCFYVQSENNLGYTSRSNTSCETRLPEYKLPNAFTPNGDGLNDYLGPFWVKGAKPDGVGDNGYIFNVDIVAFKFFVYDKYGGKVFGTQEVYKKWFGDAYGTGRKVGEGPYQYYLWFRTKQDKEYEKSGAINVLYP